MFRNLIVLVALLVSGIPVAQGVVWTVDGAGGGDFLTIQEAISAATAGDEIIVSAGAYLENIDFLGKDLWLHSDEGAASTVIDGSEGGPANGTCARFTSGETAAATLEGFTLTGGTGSLFRDVYRGGGILCIDSSPTIKECYLTDNTAQGGAAVYLSNANPSILGCEFVQNAASSLGGGISCSSSGAAPQVSDCSFVGNTAGWGGGAVHMDPVDGTFENCLFEANEASTGGAISIARQGDHVDLVGCVFRANVAIQGGAFRIHEASASLSHCVLNENSAGAEGGGFFVIDGGEASLTLCTLHGNGAGAGGHAYLGSSAGLYLTNCICTGAPSGGGLWGDDSWSDNNCCDVWNNSGGNYVGLPDPTGSDGNISQDPLYCDLPDGPFWLQSDSPCAAENNPTCGQIGTFGVGCEGPTPTRHVSWGQLKTQFDEG